ncbi:hypothetical protein, partial [Chromobacterium violaceum]
YRPVTPGVAGSSPVHSANLARKQPKAAFLHFPPQHEPNMRSPPHPIRMLRLQNAGLLAILSDF